MTFRVTKTVPNRSSTFPVRVGLTKEVPPDRMIEDIHDTLVGAAAAHPFDAQDEVVVRIEETDEEIGVPLPERMQNPSPDRFIVVRQTGPGSLWASRSALTERRTMWFRSDAAPGTEFVVIPY